MHYSVSFLVIILPGKRELYFYCLLNVMSLLSVWLFLAVQRDGLKCVIAKSLTLNGQQTIIEKNDKNYSKGNNTFRVFSQDILVFASLIEYNKVSEHDGGNNNITAGKPTAPQERSTEH